MHRFYLPPESCRSSPFLLEGREAHHAQHVLRLRQGDEVELLDGVGHRYLCSIGNLRRDQVQLTPVKTDYSPPANHAVHLLQAIPKGKLIESIIQKATELGVARVIPLLTARVILRLEEAERLHKMDKWQLTAIEAVKQCGAAWLPKVEKPLTLQEFLEKGESFELPLVACLQPGSLHPREPFTEFLKAHRRKPASVCIWVGPEGDFTPAEINAIKSSGALPVSLGQLVLRSETAALFCLSFINYELQAPVS